MGLSIDELRKNYKSFSDDELIRLATREASGLTPEGLQVLTEEIKRRNLSHDLIKGIEVQFNPLGEEAFSGYCELIRNQPCPICGSSSHKLNATITGSVVSVLIVTSYVKQLVIACPSCLNKANKHAMIKSALLGWWGLPFGFIRTIQAFILNNKMSSVAWLDEPNDLLKAFVVSHIGAIEANTNNAEGLQALTKYPR
ncbi:MAG TPA: hypothetical protein VE978_23675 [Chitinophagales bacterium]|nr:hypothetical protein [Chitinophagales bacterium]